MKTIKIIAIVFFVIVLGINLFCMFGVGDLPINTDDPSGSIGGFVPSNSMKEDTKYFFEYAELDISFDNYYNYRDAMSQDQYDSFCQMIREECQAKMNEDALEHVFYIQKEDGSYEKQGADFYIFSGGNVFNIWLDVIGKGFLNESLGYYQGSNVYYGYTNPWDELGGAEAFQKAIDGTYEGDEITFNYGDYDVRARFTDGKLKVVERYEGSYWGLDYVCDYTYYYTPQ